EDALYTSLLRAAKLRLTLPECLSFFFVFMAVVFMPLGQRIAVGLAQVNPPLRGYIINILGSIAGVAAFSLISFLQIGPWWWFGFAFAVLLALTRADRRWLIANAILALITVWVVWRAGAMFLWTPYNKLAVRSMYVSPDGKVKSSDSLLNPSKIATMKNTVGF